MSSILTNNGAMVALQTLKGINKNMAMTQSEISTGKSVATAKDNAAVWAISKVMESDVKGFEAISDSLALGESTVSVGRNAAESINSFLGEMKSKITAAQESNVPRDKLQDDISALVEQIKGVVGSAQFNGLNLVDGSSVDPVNILSSIDRAADGSVKANQISVGSGNLSTEAGTTLDAALQGASASIAGSGGASAAVVLAFQGGGGALVSSDPAADTAVNTGLLAGDTITATINDVDVSYRVEKGDQMADIVSGMQRAVNEAGFEDIAVSDSTGLVFTNNGSSAADIAVNSARGRGDMYALETLDVTTEDGAKNALAEIEGLMQKAIDTGARFGSAEKRIEIQAEFVGKLTDSMKSGIGAMVDADMEEVSARLQALQVQQQLGTQSLSIANQAPQALLSLFR